MEFAHILKANPYHDEKGRFSTEDKAKFVSTGPAFSKALEAKKKRYSQMEDVPGFDSYDEMKDWYSVGKFSKNASVSHYKQQGYVSMNAGLRHGKAMSSKDKAAVEGLSKLIKSKSLDSDVAMFRGVSGSFAERLNSMKEGSDFIDHGFTSWSVDKAKASEFSGKEKTIVVLKAKKGFNAVKADHHSSLLEGSEYELITDKGNVFIIGRKYKSKAGYNIVEVTHE